MPLDSDSRLQFNEQKQPRSLQCRKLIRQQKKKGRTAALPFRSG
jgi:hypothetical protein